MTARLTLISTAPATEGGSRPDSAASSAFRAYAPYVARIAIRLLGPGQDIEDIVQDVFVDAVSGLHKLRDEEAIRGWLATVTVRVASRSLKRRRLKRWLSLESAPHYKDVEAPGASPEQRALLGRVYTLLEQFPVDARIAWTLRHVEGEKLEAVAALCRCSLATAKRRITLVQSRIEEVLGHE